MPQYYDREARDLVIDTEYMQKMLKFHRKVNPNEGLLGMYISCKKLDDHGLALVSYFQELFQNEKKKALISFPLIMMVDPTLSGNKLSIKVSITTYESESPLDLESCVQLPQEESHLLRAVLRLRHRQLSENRVGRPLLRSRALRHACHSLNKAISS